MKIKDLTKIIISFIPVQHIFKIDKEFGVRDFESGLMFKQEIDKNPAISEQEIKKIYIISDKLIVITDTKDFEE